MAWGGIKVTEADRWFSKAVRLSKNNTCEMCGIQGDMQCCHIFGRRDKAVRYSTLNVICGCVNCHRKTGENPVDFHEWIKVKFGQKRIDMLHLKRRGYLKATPEVRRMISKHYRDEYNRMMETGDRKLASWN